jgi:N-acetylglutamate synthase-like GNAT family acetyltransferase
VSVIVRDRTSDDEAWVQSSLRLTWGSSLVARLGELIDASALPGVVAQFDGERVGLATVAFRGDECELVSLSTTVEGRGVGRALVQRCATDARAAGCRRLWLVTTNDNLRAYGFYQRLGMDLRALHRDAVTADRRLKPQIPLHGAFGIPIRHLLEFELLLEAAANAPPDREGIP